jgi:hypothetical protein
MGLFDSDTERSFARSVDKLVNAVIPLLGNINRAVVRELLYPGPMFFVPTHQNEDLTMKGHIQLPTPSVKDMGSRELTVQVGTGAPDVQVLSAYASTSNLIDRVNRGDRLNASLVDVDKSGNRSSSREYTTVVHDTIAPPQPGVMGFVLTSDEDEEPVPDPVPTPDPVPPPPPEPDPAAAG